MAASGLVNQDPAHIFVMMEFLFDIKEVATSHCYNYIISYTIHAI